MDRTLLKDLTHLAILLVLVGGLVFLLTWTGIVKCRVIPGFCTIYWTVVRGDQPRILIVYGDAGMGNPELLQQTLSDPNHAGVFPVLEHIDRINLGNLKEFDLVVVEKARKIATGKLKIFMDYVSSGGRLVWTGDAGTESGNAGDFLYANEDPSLDTNEHSLVGPWARKDGRQIVAFHEFLAVQFQTSFCSIKTCTGIPWQGTLITNPSRNHPLVYALKPGLPLRGDFAIVQDVPSSISTRVLSLDWLSDLVGKNSKNYGKIFPIIVTSGYGERVAYYAVPPDQFVEPELPQKYYSIVENMYYGMLR